MRDQLITVLNTICPGNVYTQGTLSADAYPDSFITIWVDDTPQDGAYDDTEHAFDWYFSVIYYTNDPAGLNTVPAQIRTALKAAGFMPQGKGSDVPSDRPSHAGWAMEFVKKEYVTGG